MLGVKPGVSARELKAAHRDLAKVWHPDRFLHDPRLQQKAQEKLKEINEAYKELISRQTPRSRTKPPPPRQSSTVRAQGFDYSARTYSEPHPAIASRSIPWHLVGLALLIFGAAFFVTTRTLIRHRDQRVRETEQADRRHDAATPPESDASATDSVRTWDRVDSGPDREARVGDSSTIEPATTQVTPVPTVTVMIDPATGLLATSNCPTRTRMTYPSSSEPHAYCNASHPARVITFDEPVQSKESRIKSFAKRVGVPDKWLGSGKEKPNSETRQEQ